jgi:hypothetical protein
LEYSFFFLAPTRVSDATAKCYSAFIKVIEILQTKEHVPLYKYFNCKEQMPMIAVVTQNI